METIKNFPHVQCWWNVALLVENGDDVSWINVIVLCNFESCERPRALIAAVRHDVVSVVMRAENIESSSLSM